MPLRIDVQLPELPALPILGATPTVDVFELQQETISLDALPDLARTMGLTGSGTTSTTVDENWLSYEEGPHLLDANRKTGAVIYRNLKKHGIQTDRPFQLSDRDAEEIATGFLERSQLVDPGEARVDRVTHLRGALGNVGTGEVSETTLDAGVIFRRAVADLPVDGPGGIVMINIDPNGDIVGARRIWRPLGKIVDSVPLQPIAGALAILEQIAASVRGETIVTKARLCYFEHGENDQQQFLEPAYAFVYLIEDGDVVIKRTLAIHASFQQFGTLEIAKRFPVDVQVPRPPDLPPPPPLPE